MCEVSNSQRRAYRDQDPPRIVEDKSHHHPSNTSTAVIFNEEGRKKEEEEEGISTTNEEDQVVLDELEFFRKHQEHIQRREEALITDEPAHNSVGSISRDDISVSSVAVKTSLKAINSVQNNLQKIHLDINNCKVPSTSSSTLTSSSIPSSTSEFGNNSFKEVITNGVKKDPDSCGSLTNGKEMAPVMGVPPPPPAPLMGPDGLILPRKPYNPCLISNNHKDLRRELIFNQKVGKSVLNQKSELQRALEKQREAAMRREAERNREESYKDDPRTALQRALEQRAKQIELMEHQPSVEPPNPLVTARAKLRTRTDSQ